MKKLTMNKRYKIDENMYSRFSQQQTVFGRMVNDISLSIPLAIEAGLGELGRNGLLITKDFGPCVRLCKIFTTCP